MHKFRLHTYFGTALKLSAMGQVDRLVIGDQRSDSA